jgi:hypothetical protein
VVADPTQCRFIQRNLTMHLTNFCIATWFRTTCKKLRTLCFVCLNQLVSACVERWPRLLICRAAVSDLQVSQNSRR